MKDEKVISCLAFENPMKNRWWNLNPIHVKTKGETRVFIAKYST